MDWTSMRSRWSNHATLRVIGVILLGQLVSFSIALMSLTSSLIAKFGILKLIFFVPVLSVMYFQKSKLSRVDAPLTQGLFTYATLILVYGSILLYRQQKPLVSWYWYLLLGFADVQGNYFANKSYQYTSITSATLLSCWTIPWVIILTWMFLGTRYSFWQLCGGALCVLGLCLALLSDSWDGGGDGSRPILGDVLVILATVFFAIGNVGEEFCVKEKDRVEVVTMIGVYGFLVTTVELSVLELNTLESIKWSTNIVLAFVGYVFSSFMSYTITPFVLKLGGATMFNLSILTSGMWAVVFKVFLYHQKVDWLYFLSLAIVVIGLIIYSTMIEKKNSVSAPAIEDGNVNTEYQILSGDESMVSEAADSFAS